MTYINVYDKQYLFENGFEAEDPEELAFTFAALAWDYFKRMGRDGQSLHDVLGALETTKQEFYRRAGAPYQEKMLAKNGDVYTETAEPSFPGPNLTRVDR